MKKFIFFVILVVCCFSAFSQNTETNTERLKRYWYYRDRFLNNYILSGDCEGCSVPAGIRGSGEGTPNDYASQIIKWGDATIELGWYIGILATEYKLLADNGQSTAETVKELFYALKAFNRLDETV